MSNVIVNRVKEFLHRFPPFSFLSDELLTDVAREVELMYYTKGEYIFKKGNPASPHFFVLKEGSVYLTEEDAGKMVVKDYCDEGEVFGVMALLGQRPYVLNGYVAEDSLIYAVPVDVFDKVLKENSEVSLYFAAGFAAGQVVVRTDLSQSQKARKLLKDATSDHGLSLFMEKGKLNFPTDVLSCPLGTPLREAARLMQEKDVGSIVVVDGTGHPSGIITDKDIRNRVVAAGIPYDVPVEEMMTHPVRTVHHQSDFPTIYLTMIKNHLHHLILTEDGTDQSKITGIVSDHDVFLSHGNSPAVLIHGLMNTWDVQEMKGIRDRAEALLGYFLENEVAIDFVANILSEINDVIIKRAVLLAKKKLDQDFVEESKVPFCFLSLGSEGRQEQLLRTDLDNALVFEDVDEDKLPLTKAYFEALSQEVIQTLIACGFHPCPSEVMANNPEWCQPLAVWKDYFSQWVNLPDEVALMKATIFFDFRPVYGFKSLPEEMTRHIYQVIDERKAFLGFLAKNALLNPPPLGFFKNFIVEKSGEHKDQFDIKLRAMMPLADAARLLILSHKVLGINNTFERFEKLAALEPQNASLYEEAASAYEIFLRLRALEGIATGTSGRYITPRSLGKLQRQLLKNAFAPIQQIQEVLTVRFQTDYIPK
ncbi:DUF294 nucleotidyltransferase-like domain-containing protein [Echinicola vietnamensis]|uniref:Putative signal-transduction protein containing cAMP-binding and CBS domains n=1 Tax=Echinicola vietnamensis (strain DSM 17526 / LMG 23754 / KMM 6221) TaxID=926556 RepID=L0FY37_ECHVK|nr:DUF294 nucleotidyltransferase-like domain-containing protein [Echinicola vietnamensis]AGA77540.1 putative signal-transduction protein containing cAMP-binding and CBS domains [Echinicola vietnamensis DSM 17526]